MNEIEAISVLETRIKYPNSDTYGGMCEAEYQQEAVVLAIDALREQAERSRGCEWCTGALPEDITPHREFFKNMLKGWSEDWLCVAKKVPSGEHILHCEIDTALTDFSADIPIRFCPMCGRRLEVEQ